MLTPEDREEVRKLIQANQPARVEQGTLSYSQVLRAAILHVIQEERARVMKLSGYHNPNVGHDPATTIDMEPQKD